MQKHSKTMFFYVTVVLLFTLFFLSISLGSTSLSLTKIIGGLFSLEGYEKQTLIIRSLRLPRTMGAVIAGAAFATSGSLLQQATGNDLCAPNIIGVNAGAGLFVMLMLCFLPTMHFLLPLSAFIGAVLATMLVLLISRLAGNFTSKTSLVLSGIAVGAFFNAGISFLSYMFPDVLVSYNAFTSGSLSGIYKDDIIIPSIIVIICLILSLILFPKLKILCLGDAMASSLGVNVKAVRISALLLASAMCASAVSFAGLIGFVGLIVPHIAKKLAPIDSPYHPLICMTLGASILLFSDLLGRTLFAPSELPCGIIMAAIGAPFFVSLLCKRRGKIC